MRSLSERAEWVNVTGTYCGFVLNREEIFSNPHPNTLNCCVPHCGRALRSGPWHSSSVRRNWLSISTASSSTGRMSSSSPKRTPLPSLPPSKASPQARSATPGFGSRSQHARQRHSQDGGSANSRSQDKQSSSQITSQRLAPEFSSLKRFQEQFGFAFPA